MDNLHSFSGASGMVSCLQNYTKKIPSINHPAKLNKEACQEGGQEVRVGSDLGCILCLSFIKFYISLINFTIGSHTKLPF